MPPSIVFGAQSGGLYSIKASDGTTNTSDFSSTPDGGHVTFYGKDFTRIGDTTNLASRLQGLVSPDQVVVGETTRDLLDDDDMLTSLGREIDDRQTSMTKCDSAAGIAPRAAIVRYSRPRKFDVQPAFAVDHRPSITPIVASPGGHRAY